MNFTNSVVKKSSDLNSGRKTCGNFLAYNCCCRWTSATAFLSVLTAVFVVLSLMTSLPSSKIADRRFLTNEYNVAGKYAVCKLL